MILVRVVNEFVDKHTEELHRVGDTLEVTAGRLKEIESAGFFIEKIPTKKIKDKKEAGNNGIKKDKE